MSIDRNLEFVEQSELEIGCILRLAPKQSWQVEHNITCFKVGDFENVMSPLTIVDYLSPDTFTTLLNIEAKWGYYYCLSPLGVVMIASNRLELL